LLREMERNPKSSGPPEWPPPPGFPHASQR
jgi:hypothetical protein